LATVHQSDAETQRIAVETTSQGTLLDALRRATLGEYEVLGEIGQGGMAVVFLAHDIALDRKVAIKVISPALLMMDAGIHERFLREARTSASLSHPHIIPVYAVKRERDLVYFVMKYVVGRNLESVMQQVGSMPIAIVQTILNQVGGALGYAHRRGVIHRDIKPANLMLDEDGWAVVTDFGIAKVTEEKALTMTGGTVGTPAYMSPEQCAGTEITGAADQYSLGVVSYEMISGHKPFAGESAMTLMYEHCHAEPTPIQEYRRDCPSEIADAIMRMLAKSPADRWPSVEDAIAAIGEASDTGQRTSIRTKMLGLAKDPEAQALLQKFSTPRTPVPRRSARTDDDDATAGASSAAPSRTRFFLWGIPVATAALAATVFVIQGGNSDEPVSRPEALAAVASDTGSMPGGVASLEILPYPESLAVGEAFQLQTVGRDASGNTLEDLGIVWESGNPAVATVSPQGVVTASGAGLAELTARYDTQSVTVTLRAVAAPIAPTPPTAAPARSRPPPVATLELPRGTREALVGDRFQLRVVVRDPSGRELAGRPIRWSSDRPAVATVDQGGSVTALREGLVTITASSEGRSAAAVVSVAPLQAASLSLSPDNRTITVGETLQLSATPQDDRGNPMTGQSVSWTSSHPNALQVSPTGLVAAVAPGSATVTAQTGRASASVRVVVAAPVTAPPTDPPEDPQPAIEAVLESYRRAIESRDLSQLRRAYPGMTAEQERAFRNFFANVSQLVARLTIVELQISGDTARAQVEATYEFRTSRTETQDFAFVATLERGRTGWQLVEVR
jgi:serine/threonine-protein kinase